MQNGMPRPQGMMPQGQMTPPAGPDGPKPAAQALGQGQTPASPEQQAAYNRFVGMALLHVYDEKVMPKIIGQIGDDVANDVGRAAANVGFVVLKKAQQGGETVPPEVILHGGQEVVASIAELVAKAKGIEMDPQQVEQAYYVAADTFRQMMQGEGGVDPETAAQDMEALRQMEESGELEAMMTAAAQDQAGRQ